MKKSLCTKIGASFTLAMALAAYAQPANDNCATATVVTATTSLPFDMAGGTTEHVPACGFNGVNDLWYSVEGGPAGSNVVVNVCGGATFDTILDAFDGCGGTQLACNDDSCGLQSQITFNLPANAVAMVALSGYNGASGSGTVNFTLTPLGSGPANDNCADAIAVTNGSSTPFSTIGATTDGLGTCGGYGSDIWYSYTSGASLEQVTASTCGSAYDTVLAVFDACGGAQVACLDDFCGLQTQLSWSQPAGTTYYIGVAGFIGNTGTGTLSVSAVTITPPANDNCAGATQMFEGDNIFDNTFATQDTQISCAFGGPANSGSDVWYFFTAPTSDNRNFEVTSYFNGDSTLAIYDACGGTELACNDDAIGLLSRITNFPTVEATTYYIRLSGWGNPGGQGAGVLNIAVPPPPTPFDSCELPVEVAGQVTVPFDTSGLTTDAFDCVGGIDGWFAWTPTASGQGIVTTCGLSGSDTTLGYYTACGVAPTVCVDDSCGLQTRISFPVSAGNTYLVRIAGFGNQIVNGQISFDVPPPPPNDDCASASAASLGSNPFDSTAALDDGNFGSCNFGAAPDTHDVWFDYTAGSESFITVDTFGSGMDTTMQVYDACGGSELFCNDDAGGGLQSQICNVPVTSGTHYFIRVASWGAGSAGGAGVLNIATSTGGTPFTPPAGAQDEPGTCDDPAALDVNGGCNVTPNAFTTLAVCDTFQGTGAANLPSSPGFRDTDWYEFTVDTGDTYTFTGQTQFLAFTAILDNACPPAILATAFPDPACNGTADFTVSTFLAPGTYRYFMAPQFGAGNTCGTNDQYWFRLEGSNPCPTGPICNDIDFNNDGSFFDPQDIDAFLSVFSEGPCIPSTQTCDGIDFNNDTSIFDPCDIDSFLVVFSEGPCTTCGI